MVAFAFLFLVGFVWFLFACCLFLKLARFFALLPAG